MKFSTAIAAGLGLSAGATALTTPLKTGESLEKRQMLHRLLGVPDQVSLSSLLNKETRDNLAFIQDAQKKGKIAHIMGEKNASEVFTSFARFLGATRDSPGLFMKVSLDTSFGEYGLVDQVPAEAKDIPTRSVIKSRVDMPQVKAVKVRYGPYKVPGNTVLNINGEYGVLANYPKMNLIKPCDGDCTILGFHAGLEYPNGTNANVNTGAWLHHGVLYSAGPGRVDQTCSDRDISLPHITVNSTAFRSERLFTFGNERSEVVFSELGAQYVGYKLRAADSFSSVVDLMNETPNDKMLYITITYDIIDGHPFADDVRPIWLDIRRCGTSEANPPKGKDQFQFKGDWTSNFDGEILGGLGHVHDGGLSTSLEVDGKQICVWEAKYAETPDYISPPEMKMPGDTPGGMPATPPSSNHSTAAAGMETGTGMKHISSMTVCDRNTFASMPMRKGQNWRIRAFYDFAKWPGMRNRDGSWDEVMGLSIIYGRVKGDSGQAQPEPGLWARLRSSLWRR